MNQNALPEIDVNEALEKQSEGVVLLDVREKDEFEAGHAVGALNIPLSELKDRIDEIDQTVELNIICKSGGRSAQAVMALNSIGYSATNVKGGSLEWMSMKLPFVSDTGDTPKVI
ncbi:MAG: rhodanese-like domain-containing protein [Acidimicrobiia bacterium]